MIGVNEDQFRFLILIVGIIGIIFAAAFFVPLALEDNIIGMVGSVGLVIILVVLILYGTAMTWERRYDDEPAHYSGWPG